MVGDEIRVGCELEELLISLAFPIELYVGAGELLVLLPQLLLSNPKLLECHLQVFQGLPSPVPRILSSMQLLRLSRMLLLHPLLLMAGQPRRRITPHLSPPPSPG